MNEVSGFVRIEQDHLQARRTLLTIKSFRQGETVAREKPLVQCDVDKDSHRLLAFLRLSPQDREEFLRTFTDLELSQLNLSPDQIDLAPYEELLTEVAKMEPVEAIGKREVAAVMVRWLQVRHVSRIRVYKTVSKLIHSCAASVDLDFNFETRMMSLTARYELPPQTRIGIWLLEDVSLWLKGADIRAAELLRTGVLRQVCRCERCEGPDTVRALKCPGCPTGEVARHGKDKRWRCTSCDFECSDEAARGLLDAEQKLIQELAAIQQVPEEKLTACIQTIESQLGLKHWLAADVWMEMYRRHTPQAECTFTGTLAGLCFLEWFVSRRLTVPPKPMAEQLVNMAFSMLEFLQKGVLGVRDLRIIFLRAVELVQAFLRNLDRGLLERLKPFSGAALNIRRMCAFCKARLPEQKAEDDSLVTGDEDGAVCEDRGPATCAVCQELSYCDIGCQLSDSRRHRHYCVPKGESFQSKLVAQVLIAT